MFLARASHELRTPLTSVLASIRVLKKALTGRKRHSPAELADIANRNVAVVLALLNDLLDASKLTAGEAPLALVRVALADVVLAPKGMVASQADGKAVTLRSVVPDRLVLEADPLKRLQVLANLLGNAVKFTPKGGTVGVEARLEGGEEVVIRVRDTGEGIAICRQIATLHGGHIRAESEGLGRGSTFVVTLPSRRSKGGRAARARCSSCRHPAQGTANGDTRIVRCVSACEGIPNDELKAGVIGEARAKQGRLAGPNVERTTFEDLATLLVTD